MRVVEQFPTAVRVRLLVRGLVQGVGFRPFVFALAARRALRGCVRNNATGVLIDLEGAEEDIEQFIREVKTGAPPLAFVESVERATDSAPAHYADFRIVESDASGAALASVPADIATCADCLAELFNPSDRRYRYPFVNCTNCGPRFTIIEDVPYDRARTTMRAFALCAACRAEYENPHDRRFHAEPTACPACGPRLRLTDKNGRELASDGSLQDDVVARTRSLLADGKIVAVKGIGGFHLACDALNAAAVEQLRRAKHREDKPFALMAASVDVVKAYCFVSEAEGTLLASAPRPVVLLEQSSDARLPQAIAPRAATLGFMLPYSPLHHLLLEGSDRPLVMTSGNLSDEPICIENEDALRRLPEIADHFLLHDRRIHVRADDSVTRVVDGREQVLRRARGYAPRALKTSFSFAREVLACGAELKSTFCFGRGRDAFVSQHIGDLENLETLRAFEQGIERYQRLFHLRPAAVAYDLHPEYLSTKYALALTEMETKIGVQHHHAHVASCMADNQIEGEVIGVALDGLGFGVDGKLWGGEFFVADFREAERVAYLDYVPLPGGARAIREPWRMAAVYLHRAFGDDFLKLPLPFVEQLDTRAWATLRKMAATGTNSPETSSMGRLFDAVSSLLGVRHMVNYEGQAAIELEALTDQNVMGEYEFEIGAGGVINAESLIRRAVEDLLDGIPASQLSARFHAAVASLIAAVARGVRAKRGLNRIALSGGVFQNVLLLNAACRLLRRDGFAVFTHSRVPTNDGGISFGQAAVAQARIAAGKV